MKKSRWGAIGALLVLQCFGLFMFYLFASTAAVIFTLDFSEAIPNVFRFFVICVILVLFIFFQKMLFQDINVFLQESPGIDAWLKEARTTSGRIRIMVIPLLGILYALLLLGPELFRIKFQSLGLAIGFQIFHIAVSWWAGKPPPAEGENPPSAPSSKPVGTGFKARMADSLCGLALGAFLIGGAIILSEPLLILKMLGVALITVVAVYFLFSDYS